MCSSCLRNIANAPLLSACRLCAEPLPPDVSTAYTAATDAMLCFACRAEKPRFVRATSYGLYDNLRPAIRLMKFEGIPSLSVPLGALLAQAILKLREDAPPALAVVPVPLFRGKRAFNQSTLLAQEAIRILRQTAPGWELLLQPDLLRRIRRTQSQFLLSPAQRRQNLRGAFQAAPTAQSRNILLIDDVYTTGATVDECTRVLLAAGAQSVRVATLARAGRDVAETWLFSATATDRPAQRSSHHAAALFP